jgi:hypothetical protein
MRRRKFKKACCRESLPPLKDLAWGILTRLNLKTFRTTLLHRSSREATGVGVDAFLLLDVPTLAIFGNWALVVR